MQEDRPYQETAGTVLGMVERHFSQGLVGLEEYETLTQFSRSQDGVGICVESYPGNQTIADDRPRPPVAFVVGPQKNCNMQHSCSFGH
jgi:hypothetical protein